MKINWFKIDNKTLTVNIALLFFHIESENLNSEFNVLLNYLKIGSTCKDCNRSIMRCKCFDNEIYEFEIKNYLVKKIIKLNFSKNNILLILREIDIEANHYNYSKIDYYKTEVNYYIRQLKDLINEN